MFDPHSALSPSPVIKRLYPESRNMLSSYIIGEHLIFSVTIAVRLFCLQSVPTVKIIQKMWPIPGPAQASDT